MLFSMLVVIQSIADDPQVDNLKHYFEGNFILPRHKTMDELILILFLVLKKWRRKSIRQT